MGILKTMISDIPDDCRCLLLSNDVYIKYIEEFIICIWKQEHMTNHCVGHRDLQIFFFKELKAQQSHMFKSQSSPFVRKTTSTSYFHLLFGLPLFTLCSFHVLNSLLHTHIRHSFYVSHPPQSRAFIITTASLLGFLNNSSSSLFVLLIHTLSTNLHP